MEHLLKSCYVCGGVSEIKNCSGSHLWVIKCRNPRCKIKPSISGGDIKTLLKEWNDKNHKNI